MATKKELQKYLVELVTECFGTCILILLNEGAIANYKFGQLSSHSTLIIYLAIGVGVYTGTFNTANGTYQNSFQFAPSSDYRNRNIIQTLMAAGSVTGAHINPAVSISLMTVRKLKPLQCLFYVVGQVLGAFLGAALVYLVYWSQFNNFDGGMRQIAGVNGTADIFFTMPGKGVPHWNALIDQIVSTSILLIFIMAVEQNFNRLISNATKPFALILIVMGLNCAYSVNAAAALNPARDFGPRLFGAFVYGWNEVFSANNYYFWVPIVGPILGGVIGVWIFQCYAAMITNYGQFSIIEHRNSADIDRRVIKTDDDGSELRQQLTTVAD